VSRLLFDVRYSVRKFVRVPGLALALLLTIALGIGSNVSIYGFARGLTRPLFAQQSLDAVVSLLEQDVNHGSGPLSYEDYLFFKRHRDPFQWVGAARILPVAIVVSDQPAIVSGAAVTRSLAGALDLSLDKGAVISHRLWQTSSMQRRILVVRRSKSMAPACL
jgi:putative ABC transport system permease protein